MKQSAGKKRSAWSLVGRTLLGLSALWWLFVFFGIAFAEDAGEIATSIKYGLILSAVPIAIGIYCVRRGRKEQAPEAQQGPELVAEPVQETQQSVVQIKDSGSEIALTIPVWARVIAWILLLFGVGLVPAALMGWAGDPSGANGEKWIPAGFGLFFVLLGIWMVGMTTKITFNQPPGYMTVTLGKWPLFLWFLRTKRISKEEARSAFVRSVKRMVSGGDWNMPSSSRHTAYQVKVVMNSGKEVTLHEDWNPDVSNYLARRISEFSQQ